jgi:hypothetical protein
VQSASSAAHLVSSPVIACLLQRWESGYEDKPLRDIVRELFSYADGCTFRCEPVLLVHCLATPLAIFSAVSYSVVLMGTSGSSSFVNGGR